MKIVHNKALIFIMLLCSFRVYAQQGTISGKIVDAQTGEELIGATVQVESISVGTVTDISGNYQLQLDPGTYTLTVSYISYANQKIEGVQVNAGKNQNIDVALKEENTELQEVVVTAQAIRDNDVALLQIQKNALAVQDGISAKEIQQLGSSNAAESIKQVTGASVEEGKYVVLRGLGDRYTISQLNGVTLPSTDPYRNSTSLDLVPSDVVENIVTVKTYTPDQPGNFTGGKVDITTKSLPEEFFFNFGLSTTYNTQSSMINDFITDGAKGDLDALGYDDGTRAIPDVVLENRNELANPNRLERLGRNPANEAERELLNNTSRAFKTPFLAEEISTPLNFGANLSTGNRVKLFGKNLGYSVGLSYDRSYSYYGDGQYGIFFDGGGDQLVREQTFSVRDGSKNTQVGAFASASYQLSSNNELTLSYLYNHNNAENARISGGIWRSVTAPYFEDRSTTFEERELSNIQLRGNHSLQNLAKIKLEWTLGYVQSSQDEPDVRLLGFTTNEANRQGIFGLNQSEIGFLPSHFSRSLDDEQYNGQLDITIPITQKKDNQIKAGFSYSNKTRDFTENIFSMIQQVGISINPDFTTFAEAGEDDDLSDFFALNNFGVVNTPESTGTGLYGFGNYYQDQTRGTNIYTGKELIMGAYAMAAYNITDKIKLIAGLRVESTDFSAQPQEGASGSIKTTDLLPAVNAIYKVNDNSNIRIAASQTLARPNLREIAPFASFSGIAYPITLGNPDLDRTLVQNYDLRYEIYPKPGDIFAVSVYYKNFQNPIVLQLTPGTSSTEIRPVNVASGRVAGAEIEFRKSLGFISPALENLRFSINGSIIDSEAERTEQELAVIKNADRPNLKDTRPFQGQSPYIINTSLFYNIAPLAWDNSLSFNIWGERLAFATPALDPDVYEQPRPILNFTSSKKLGDHYTVGFKASNLLNPNFQKTYDFNGEPIYESYTTGRSFSVSISYGIN